MNGLKTTSRTDYVWDGVNEDDRPATATELATARHAYRKKVGRPALPTQRPTLNMRVDADVLSHLRASGQGWQTRVNLLLREAVERGAV